MGRKAHPGSWRLSHVAKLEEIEAAAIEGKQFTAAVTARRLIRLDASEVEAERVAQEIAAIPDPIARAEATARAALAAGSFLAAERANQRADELRRIAADEERQRQIAANENLTDEEAVQSLIDELLSAPAPQAAQVLYALQRRPDLAPVAEA